MKLDDLEVYKLAEELSNCVWDVCQKWNYFTKETIGKQLIKAVDSVSANIAEGFGRFHYKDNINFLYFSRGSLVETQSWLNKAHKRNLLTDKKYEYFCKRMDELAKKLNAYIKSNKKQLEIQ